MIAATIGDISCIRWFSSACYLKKWKIRRSAIFLKGKINRMEIEIISENESQLQKIRKPLLNQKESLAVKVKKCLCLFDKRQ